MSDEDRLFATLPSWNIRLGPILKANPGRKGIEMVDEILMKFEGIKY